MSDNKPISLHPITLITLNLIFILSVLFVRKTYFNLHIVFISILLSLFHNKIHKKIMWQIIIFFLPVALSYFVTNYLFKSKLNYSELMQLITRIFAIYTSSILCTLQIDFVDLIYYLMRRCNLSVKIGYPLIGAINSIKNFKVELNRIRIAYKMKHTKKPNYLKILPSLFISAARFSYYNAISFETRQLKQNKTYIKTLVTITTIDYLVVIFMVIILGILYSIIH